MGGRRLLKGVDIGSLVAAHASRLRGAVVIGAERAAVLEALRRHAPEVPVIEVSPVQTEDTMTDAVTAALLLARAGDTVLLARGGLDGPVHRLCGSRPPISGGGEHAWW